jgi:hypothetical protein
MKPCTCGKQLDRSAKVCPGCGKAFKTTSAFTKLIGIILFLIFTPVIIYSIAETNAVPAPGSVGLSAAQQAAQKSPEQVRTEALAHLSPRAKKLCTDHPIWEIDICNRIAKHEVQIGMTAEQIRLSWGAPEKINSTVLQNSRSEQWVYSSDYLYVEDGILMSLQTSR